MASAFHWTPRYIERELTDELLVLYLDEEVDRQSARAQVRFGSMVEAVRAGTIFAHDNKQHGRWVAAQRNAGGGRKGLTGQALEAAVMRIAGMFPENVQRVTA